MKLAAKSDIGMQRENNQDSYSFGEILPGVCYGIVCDGMGGAAEGAVASRECARIVRERITSAYYEGIRDTSIKALLNSSIELANRYIYNMSLTDARYEGMGTTVVVAIVTRDYVYISHAGDSRAYLINPSLHTITQLTRDHSVVQRMVENGTITAEQAVDHPERHLITRAVGVDETIRSDFCQEDVSAGDIILLCTDGLTNYSTVDELLISSEGVQLEEYISQIVEKANANGGGDNITAVAISV